MILTSGPMLKASRFYAGPVALSKLLAQLASESLSKEYLEKK